MGRTSREVVAEMRFLGGMPFAYASVAALAGGGRADAALRLACAIGACYALLFVIRVCCYRQRPEAEPYRGILGKFSAASFPSLHAARAGVQAVVLGATFPHPGVWGVLGTLAVLTGVSRVQEGRHSVWDVASGAVVGAAVAAGVLAALPASP